MSTITVEKSVLCRIANKLEKKLSLEGHDWCGEYQCSICSAAGRGDIEHNDGCPMGELWQLINEAVPQ